MVKKTEKKLRIASCQFPVTEDIKRNAKYIRHFMRKAAKAGADLLHTPETACSGYVGHGFDSFDNYDWELLRKEIKHLRKLAKKLGIWLVLGSTHYLDENTKPTNCLYIIDSAGEIIDRYDKSMCGPMDQKYFSPGNHQAVVSIKNIKIGFAICYDSCYPQIYAAYREQGVKLMLHSFHNAAHSGSRKHYADMINLRIIPTRCSDNQMWAVANNSSQPHSSFGSFVARPDMTIPKQLKRNVAGMLIHDFPDEETAWTRCQLPMQMVKNENLYYGTPSSHPRQINTQSEP